MYGTAQKKSGETREELILAHYPLVRTVAYRMVKRFPHSVDVDDLISVGTLGLIDAVDRFEAGRAVSFKAYAEIRIRGAIVDELRKLDWIPRSVRRRVNLIEAARKDLRRELKREPTRQEMAEKLELTTDQFDQLEKNALVRALISLDEPTHDDSTSTLADNIADTDGANNAFTLIDKRETAQELNEAVAELPDRERAAVNTYLDGTTLKDVAQVLEVTESRVSQLRTRGRKRLRKRLEPLLAA